MVFYIYIWNRIFAPSDLNSWFQHEASLHALAKALLEYETLTAEDIKQILNPYRQEQVAEQPEEELALS